MVDTVLISLILFSENNPLWEKKQNKNRIMCLLYKKKVLAGTYVLPNIDEVSNVLVT